MQILSMIRCIFEEKVNRNIMNIIVNGKCEKCEWPFLIGTSNLTVLLLGNNILTCL